MSIASAPARQPAAGSADDPFRLGWRYVKVEHPDGTVEYDQVPLTEEDILHPEEEDFVVHTGEHERDCRYLQDVFLDRTANRPGLLSLHDHRVDWGVPEPRPHGPDIVLFDGVTAYDPSVGTFYVADHRARPLLVIEVTSPSTREKDLGIKVRHYHMVRVPLYVIIDREHEEGVRLLVYEYRPRVFVLKPLENGRVWLEPVGLWLGLKDGRAACFDGETDQELGDYSAVARALETERLRAESERARAESERARAESERARAESERTRADAQQARADAEAEAREAAELRLRELESQLRSSGGMPPQS